MLQVLFSALQQKQVKSRDTHSSVKLSVHHNLNIDLGGSCDVPWVSMSSLLTESPLLNWTWCLYGKQWNMSVMYTFPFPLCVQWRAPLFHRVLTRVHLPCHTASVLCLLKTWEQYSYSTKKWLCIKKKLEAWKVRWGSS